MSTSYGRSQLPLVLALVGVAVVAGLFVSGVFSTDSTSNDYEKEQEDPKLVSGAKEATKDTKSEEGVGLISPYGKGDLGAATMRLLWVSDSAPVVDQPVKLFGRRGVEVGEVKSDAQGRVAFSQLAPYARYTLSIEGDGFAKVGISGVKIEVGRTTDIGDVLLGERVVLRGRVLSASGRPLPGSSVSIHEMRANPFGSGFLFTMAEEATSVPLPRDRVKTDEEGYFTFATLQNGSYRLVARHGGYASRHRADVVVDGNRSAAELRLVLGQGAIARGTVKTADGKPVPNAQIVALRDFGWGGRQNLRNPFQREVTVSDDAGRYVLDTLQLGARYRFGVIAEGFPTTYDQRGVDIPEGGLDRDFVVEEGGTIKGVVVAKNTGEPVPGVKLAAIVGQMGRGQGSAMTAETDDTGAFEFPLMMAGPVMSLAAKKPGYVTETRSMFTGNGLAPITAGDTQDVRLEMQAGGTISGQIKDDAGTPISGAFVTVSGGPRGMRWTGAPEVNTVEDGTYTLVGVPAGSYKVIARAEGFSSAEHEESFELPEGGSVRARDLALTQSGRAMGVVLTPDGEPLMGARVVAEGREPESENNQRGRRRGRGFRQRMENARIAPATTDANGKFVVKGLGPKKDWTLRVKHDDFVSTVTQRFRVKAGEAHETEITMLTGASIRGTVIDENGRRAARVRIQAGHLDPQLARRVHLSSWEVDQALGSEAIFTNDEGEFTVTNIEPGRVVIRAQKDGYVDFYRRNISLAAGQKFDGYRIEMSRGETVKGTIRGADGKPLQNAWVALDPRQNPTFGRGGGGGGNDQETVAEGESGGDTVAPRLVVQTDASGKFTFERVPAGTWSALVWFAMGHKSFRDDSEAAIQRGVNVPGTEIEMRLEAADAPAGGGR